MIDLYDVTAIVSVRIDSADRLRNAALFLRYFETFFERYEIVLIEQDIKCRMAQLLSNRQGVLHHFIESGSCHTKARNLNLAASLSERPYLLMCDLDCFVPPACIQMALSKLAAGADFVLPYNGVVVQIKQAAIDQQVDFNALLERLPFFSKLYEIRPPEHDPLFYEPFYGGAKRDATGGMALYNRKQFVLAGGMNENFLSWGLEDVEFGHRIRKLGYNLSKVDEGNCYHFEHMRKTESCVNNFYRTNEAELARVLAMGQKELRHYVNAGFKRLRLDGDVTVTLTNDSTEYKLKLDKRDAEHRS